MIHPLIVHLNRIYFPNQWLFLLTAYELGKTEWQARKPVLEAMATHFKSTDLPRFMQGLEAKGTIEQRKVTRGSTSFIEIRVTPTGERDLKAAFKLARQSQPQAVPA